jgi:hypothetical protein
MLKIVVNNNALSILVISSNSFLQANDLDRATESHRDRPIT